MSKNIMITGASTGIGYAVAAVFVANGFRVFGSVRKPEDGEKVKSELGENFIPILFDVIDHEAVKAGAAKVQEMIGDEGLALLVNNAGIAVMGPLAITDISEYRRQFEVNVFGLIVTTQAFLPMLGASIPCAHDPGKIINISSVAGQLAFPFTSPYAGSKSAVEAISQSLRRELLMYGIDVVIVGPGAIKTPIWQKATPPTEKQLSSDYGRMYKSFGKEFTKGASSAMDVEVLADNIFNIFKNNKPKTRYAFLNDKFKKWTIPKYFMSDRQLDGFIKKMFRIK
jgi:NAD(P)-dependent dehydrogenase (short-subunit alcohol dehydrogenase family)